MWIFGYGSLMADGWEKEFGYLRRCVAVLEGYGRTFDKASIRTWGSNGAPCPTLNLKKIAGAVCKGIAFEFPIAREEDVRSYLVKREGKDFSLEPINVRLDDGAEVPAQVALYGGKNVLAADTVQAKAIMVTNAKGTVGSCRDYLKDIRELLAGLGIDDPTVSELWQAVQDELLKAGIDDIRRRLEALESSLPKRLDGYAVSPYTKLPFKVLLYREVLAWRMAELSRNALELLESDRITSAITLVRAAVETSAALWYLWGKLDSAVVAKSVGDIDDYLMKLIMGSKTNPDLPQPINVLTFVDRTNKDIDGFRQQYDELSEFAHPNWAGTVLLYSKSDKQNLWTDFGSAIRGGPSTKRAGAMNLKVALMIFERNYVFIGNLMPLFVSICENRGQASGMEL
jgi:cation transport protein ChaC